MQNIVYKTFSTKKEVLNNLGPAICKALDESVKCWNVGSGEYAAWSYLLQLCCEEVFDFLVFRVMPFLERPRSCGTYNFYA